MTSVMDLRDMRHRDEIQSRVALHKRKHIPFLLREGFQNASKASDFDASHPNLIAAEIYMTGTTGLAKSEWKR